MGVSKKIIILAAAIVALIPNAADAAVAIGMPSNFLTTGQGLVGWWTFDGPEINWATGAVKDKSGQVSDLFAVQMSTSSATVLGKIGQAINFTSAGGHIIRSSGAPVVSTMTLSAWVYPRSGGDGGIGRIISTDNYSLRFFSSGGNQVQFIGNCDGTDITNTSPTTVNVNKWNHIAVSWNGICGSGSRVVYYINGTPTTISDAGAGSQVTGASSIFFSYSSQWMDGYLDDVRIYNRVLRPDEIQRLNSAGQSTAKVTGHATPVGVRGGLVGWWTLDEVDVNWTTGAVTDKTGNGYTGYLQGEMATATAHVQGKYEKSLDFDGTDDEIKLGTTLDITYPFTISAWVNPEDRADYHSIFNKRDSTGAANTRLDFLLDISFGRVAIYNGTSLFTSDDAVPTNAWTHLVLTAESNTTYKLYMDSKHVHTFSTITLGNASGAEVHIGATHQSGVHDDEFNGKIDDVRLYNRALTEAEVIDLFAAGAYRTGATPTGPAGYGLNSGLVGHWTFDGPDVNWRTGAMTDKSGNANTGSAVNMSTSTTPILGIIGQAFDFRGNTSANFVNVSGAAGLNHAGSRSVSAWVYPRTVAGCCFTIFQNYQLGGSTSGMFQLQISDSDMGVNMNDGATWHFHGTSGDVMRTNKWQHVVGVFNENTDRIQIYIDGTLLTNEAETNAMPAPGNNSAIIGRSDASNEYFDGTIDDLRVFNRALTADEVARLYNLGR